MVGQDTRDKCVDLKAKINYFSKTNLSVYKYISVKSGVPSMLTY